MATEELNTSDQELFDQATAEEQTENIPESPKEASTEAKPERARDETGKFIKAAPEPSEAVANIGSTPAGVEKTPETDHSANIPSWRLAEESQRRRDAEARERELQSRIAQIEAQVRMQQAQAPQPEPIDPFADPQGWVGQIQQQFQKQLREQALDTKLQIARIRHPDTFDKAHAAFVEHGQRTGDQATLQRVMQSNDPGEALVSWYKEAEILKELGGTDVKSWLEKKQEEWLKDPAIQAKAIELAKAQLGQASPNSITQLPPSLSRIASAGPVTDDDISVDDGRAMFAYATAKRR